MPKRSSGSRLLCVLALAVLLGTGCGGTKLTPKVALVHDPGVVDARCVLPGEPTEVHRDGDAMLLVWELTLPEVWFEAVLPPSPALRAYRQAILQAGGDLKHPVADPPDTSTAALQEVWRRENANRDLAYSGEGGIVRPMFCFEGLFFAYQAERFSQLTQPTEFIVAVVGRHTPDGLRARVYFAGSSEMFPPKTVYPFHAVARDVADGWEFLVVLHNHTVRSLDGAPALGVTAPSTHDVELSRNLAQELGLQAIQVTNGFYTVEIPTAMLDAYHSPAPSPGKD